MVGTMSLFACTGCGCVENTALCGYWFKGDKPALCSECDPDIGKWHGVFPKVDAVAEGYHPTADDSNFITKQPVDG